MTSQYEAQLAAVPQQYQALRNQASAEAVMNQRIANEQLANLGLARSGQMLTTQAQTGAAMQNRMAEIDAAQQAAESEIQQAIFKLQSEGRADEAELIAANQKELTQALLDEYSRQQEAGQQQFENQLALSKFNYQQQADAQDLAMEEAKFRYKQQSDAQELAYKVQQAKADQQYKYDALKQQYGLAKANLILQQQKAQQSAYQFEVSQRLKELSQQQDFSIKEANLALNQAKLAAENDPTTLKNQKLLLDIEKTKQAIAQADIKNPLEIEKLKKQIANIGSRGGSSSGGSNNSDAVQHALNVIQGNQEKGIQYIVNTGKQYNFGSYITKMKQDGTWSKLSDKEKNKIIAAVNKTQSYANTEANKRKKKTDKTNAYYQAGS